MKALLTCTKNRGVFIFGTKRADNDIPKYRKRHEEE
jgi:hypothetical protein